MRENPSPGDSIIDSRDVIRAIEDLEDDLRTCYDEESKEKLEELFDRLTEEYDDYCGQFDPESASPGRPLPFEAWLRQEAAAGEECDASLYLELRSKRLPETFEEWLEQVEKDPSHLMQDDAELYRLLVELQDDAEGYGDWDHGETLILDEHFVEYAEQLADDIGAIDREARWPLNHIDWDAAAEELRQDYTEVRFGSETYLMRT